jgi:small-conductance mechanosensitive channel
VKHPTRSRHRPARLRPRSWIALLLVAIALLMPAAPARLQAREATSASVQLDGRPLFRVWSSEEYSAEQRVEGINRVLQTLVDSPAPIEVSVVERRGLPVIAIDSRPLLTVTRVDTPEGMSREERAEQWRSQLQRALEQSHRERQPERVLASLAAAAGMVLAALVVQRLLGWLFRWVASRQAALPVAGRPRRLGGAGRRLLLHGVLRSLQIAGWLVAVIAAADLLPQSRIWMLRLREALWNTLVSPFLPLGERSYSILDAIVLIALFVALSRSLAALQRLLRRTVLQPSGISKGSQEAIAFLVQYTLLFIGTLVLLQLWGLEIGSLAIFAGFLGVALGLGLQGFARNFLSGLLILFERPIAVGDFVEVGSLQGTVRRISLRATEVVTLDQISIIVPNSEFLESQVVNWSHGDPVSRLVIPVGVAYGSDSRCVEAALLAAAEGYPELLQDPPARVLFSGFGESQLNFNLLVWIRQPLRQYEVISDLNFRIEAELRRRGILIPYPQRDLHLRDGVLQIALPTELSEALTRFLAAGGPPRPPGAE